MPNTFNEKRKAQAYADVSTCTYPANKLKAFDILDGKLDFLNGLKTANFARNISGCQNSVTVDVHIYSVVNGKRFTAKTVGGIPRKVYADISQAFQDTASKLDITPAQLQAIVWQTWRRIHGLTTHSELTDKLF
jgi:thermostable 8-oxoguanine DNA glycosylase